IVRGYMKPIPTLIKPLESVDVKSGESMPTRYERSDVTSVPAASTVAEATISLIIANAFLEKYGCASLDRIRPPFQAHKYSIPRQSDTHSHHFRADGLTRWCPASCDEWNMRRPRRCKYPAEIANVRPTCSSTQRTNARSKDMGR